MSFRFPHLMYIVSCWWVLCCDFPPLQLPPLLLSLFLHSLSPQLYPCIQVLTAEANKCLIVAGEERPHRSRSLSLLWCRGWGGGSRFEDTSWEGKIKIEKKGTLERWALCEMEGRAREIKGSVLRQLVLLPRTTWFIWCPLGCISAYVLDYGEHKKEQCTFPSMFTLVLLFYSFFLYKAQTHFLLTGVTGCGKEKESC